MYKKFKMLSVIAIALGLGACSATRGNKPDATPPRMVFNNVTRDIVWDRPEAFGQVPTELQETGNSKCVGIGIATGYHPEAKDVDGNLIPGGGYFCQQP